MGDCFSSLSEAQQQCHRGRRDGFLYPFVKPSEQTHEDERIVDLVSLLLGVHHQDLCLKSNS